jgi:hypothetical protein
MLFVGERRRSRRVQRRDPRGASTASGAINIELLAISAPFGNHDRVRHVRLNESKSTVRSEHGRGSQSRSGRSARGQ